MILITRIYNEGPLADCPCCLILPRDVYQQMIEPASSGQIIVKED